MGGENNTGQGKMNKNTGREEKVAGNRKKRDGDGNNKYTHMKCVQNYAPIAVIVNYVDRDVIL